LVLGSDGVPVPVYVARTVNVQTLTTETSVYLQDAERGLRWELFRVGGWYRVSVSPRSPHAVIWGSGGGGTDVQLVRLRQNTSTPLTRTATVRLTADATWSYDGVQFAFVVMDAGYFRDVVVRVDTTGSMDKVTERGVGSFQPSLGTDGAQVAYTVLADWRHEIYLWDSTTDTHTLIIEREHNGFNPALSPDETRLVYTSRREYDDALYLLDLTTGEETRLFADRSVKMSAPALWSPDGRYLAYAVQLPGDNARQLYLIDTANGNAVMPLFERVGVDMEAIAWAGNGEWLALRANFNTPRMQVFMVNIHTGARVHLAEDVENGVTFAAFADW
jgi:Tol biopolymer transport system component